MLKTLMSQIKEYKRASILTPVFMILEVVVDTLMPLVMASLIDGGVEGGNIGHIIRMCLIMSCLSGAGLATGRKIRSIGIYRFCQKPPDCHVHQHSDVFIFQY